MHVGASGWKLFDKQADYIGTGNVSSATQFSWYVRPYCDVKNGGYIGRPGDFLRYDLHMFDGCTPGVPAIMREMLEDKERKNPYILYSFRTKDPKTGELRVFAYLLTDADNNYICSTICCPPHKSWTKRSSALEMCKQKICA